MIGSIGLILSIALLFFDKKDSIILDFINPTEPTEAESLILKKYRKEEEEDDESDEDEDEVGDEF